MKTAALGLVLLQFGGLDAPVKKVHQQVQYLAEPQVVSAGERTRLELRFVVEPGFHVNSHAPKSELQIATRVELAPSAGVRMGAAEYPAGEAYRLAGSPGETLDVYSRQFAVRVPVVALAGEHELKGTLTYQACDQALCYPARTVPLDVVFTAK